MSKLVIISGYFNPLHVGHLDYIATANSLGDELWVIVNSDKQVGIKGSVPFQSEEDRLRIVKHLKSVDSAFLSIDDDGTVIKTLEILLCVAKKDGYKILFANGGDRLQGNTPEEVFCEENGIETIYGVGGKKVQSSSELISKASDKEEEPSDNTKLPCPFCGGQPQAKAMDSMGLYWYECDTCEASCGGTEDWAEATKKWNKRI